jgi:hypothetical protein
MKIQSLSPGNTAFKFLTTMTLSERDNSVCIEKCDTQLAGPGHALSQQGEAWMIKVSNTPQKNLSISQIR